MRPYVPGDDVRLIDWNVTARTQEPHIRVHLAERVLVTWIVLDTSPSMAFGTAERRKADVALGVTLAVGHAATMRGNRVGLVGFGGDAERVLQPTQGRAGLVGLLLALRDEQAAERRRRPARSARRRRSTGSRAPRGSARSSSSSPTSAGRATGGARCCGSPGATRSSPSRCAIRASRSSSRVGHPLARRPRVGPRAPGQHERREAARALRRRRAGGAAGGGARARERGRRPRDALDRPRLAARPGGLRQAEAAMTLRVADRARPAARDPAARRRPAPRRPAAPAPGRPLREPRARPEPRPLVAGAPPLRAARARARSRSRSSSSASRGRTSCSDVTRDEATMILTIDTSRSMEATDVEPNRFAAAKTRGARVPRGGARLVRRRHRLVLDLRRPRAAADDRPRGRARRRSTSSGSGRAPRSAQAIVRSAELALEQRGAASGRGRRARRRPAPSSSSRTAPRRPARCKPPAAAQRARELGVPVSTIALGTGDAVVEVPRPGGLTERVVVAPDLPDAAPDRADDGRARSSRRRAPRASRRSTASSGRGSPSTASASRSTSAFAAGGAVLLLARRRALVATGSGGRL